MRVLITTDTVGGVWTFTSELTQQLLQRGHAVHLVSFGRKPSPEQEALCSSLRDRHPNHFGFTASEIPLEWMQNNERAQSDGENLLQYVIRSAAKPDLIISNQFCFGALATTIPRLVVAHSDVLSWAAACRPEGLEPSPWLDRYISLVQAGLRQAAAVAAPTVAMAKVLVDHLPAPHGVTVISNGVSVEAPNAPLYPRKLQATTAGRLWDLAKGLDTLRGFTGAMPLLVAGDNTFEGTGGDVDWPGNLVKLGPLSRPALHQQFRESAVYLCTSRYEPFGLAPLEAALCGCAIVARDLPSLREVWADNALFFKENVALGQLLHRLRSEPRLLAEYQARGLERAREFTPARMAEGYLDLFHSVLRQQRAMPHVA